MLFGRGKEKQGPTPYSFQERFQDIQRIAIIYPEREQWLRIARYTLQNLYSLPEQFEFLIMHSPNSERGDLETRFSCVEIDHNPKAEAKVALMNQVVGFNPQLLLQLEPAPSEALEKALAELKIPLKIGFGSEKAGLNIVYSQKPTGFYEKNLLNLISLLKR